MVVLMMMSMTATERSAVKPMVTLSMRSCSTVDGVKRPARVGLR